MGSIFEKKGGRGWPRPLWNSKLIFPCPVITVPIFHVCFEDVLLRRETGLIDDFPLLRQRLMRPWSTLQRCSELVFFVKKNDHTGGRKNFSKRKLSWLTRTWLYVAKPMLVMMDTGNPAFLAQPLVWRKCLIMESWYCLISSRQSHVEARWFVAHEIRYQNESGTSETTG